MLSPIFSPDFPQVSVVPGGTVRLLSEVHDVVQVQSTLQICPGIGSRRRVALTSQAGGRGGRQEVVAKNLRFAKPGLMNPWLI